MFAPLRDVFGLTGQLSHLTWASAPRSVPVFVVDQKVANLLGKPAGLHNPDRVGRRLSADLLRRARPSVWLPRVFTPLLDQDFRLELNSSPVWGCAVHQSLTSGQEAIVYSLVIERQDAVRLGAVFTLRRSVRFCFRSVVLGGPALKCPDADPVVGVGRLQCRHGMLDDSNHLLDAWRVHQCSDEGFGAGHWTAPIHSPVSSEYSSQTARVAARMAALASDVAFQTVSGAALSQTRHQT